MDALCVLLRIMKIPFEDVDFESGLTTYSIPSSRATYRLVREHQPFYMALSLELDLDDSIFSRSAQN